jgi:hypothetical protein
VEVRKGAVLATIAKAAALAFLISTVLPIGLSYLANIFSR